MANESENEPNFSDEDLEKLFWWTGFICALALPTGFTLIFDMLPDYGKPTEAGMRAMLEVFLRTAPLTVAFAFTTLSLARNWFQHSVTVIAVLFGAAWFLGFVGVGIAPAMPKEIPSRSTRRSAPPRCTTPRASRDRPPSPAPRARHR